MIVVSNGMEYNYKILLGGQGRGDGLFKMDQNEKNMKKIRNANQPRMRRKISKYYDYLGS